MITILVVAMLFFAMPAYAQTFSFHSGSYLGFVSLGLEKEFFKNDVVAIAQDARGGYVPAAVGGRDLFSLSTRTRFSLRDLPPLDDRTVILPYASAGLIYAIDKATFVILPKKYPKRYPPTGLLVSPAVGVGVKRGPHEVFFEVASLDKYIEYRSRNTRELSYRDIMTWGFGYRHYLERKVVKAVP